MAKSSQFLKIKDKNGGFVEGECYDEDHLREIDVLSWHWGVEDPAAPAMTPGSKADETKTRTKTNGEGESDRRPKPSRLKFSKATDRSTTRLLGAMDRGEIFPLAVLTIEEKYEEAPLPFFMQVELTDVFVVDFKWHATAEDAGMTFGEDWELNYSDIHFKYHWRGGAAGWIQQKFVRPPDAIDGPSKKAPLSPAEQKALDQEKFKENAKKAAKK